MMGGPTQGRLKGLYGQQFAGGGWIYPGMDGGGVITTLGDTPSGEEFVIPEGKYMEYMRRLQDERDNKRAVQDSAWAEALQDTPSFQGGAYAAQLPRFQGGVEASPDNFNWFPTKFGEVDIGDWFRSLRRGNKVGWGWGSPQQRAESLKRKRQGLTGTETLLGGRTRLDVPFEGDRAGPTPQSQDLVERVPEVDTGSRAGMAPAPIGYTDANRAQMILDLENQALGIGPKLDDPPRPADLAELAERNYDSGYVNLNNIAMKAAEASGELPEFSWAANQIPYVNPYVEGKMLGPPREEDVEKEEATGLKGFLKKYGPELLIGGGMLGGSLFGRDKYQVNRPNRPFPSRVSSGGSGFPPRAAAGAIVDTNGSPLDALVAEAGEREFVGDFPAVRDQLGLERHEIPRVLSMPQLQGGGVATDEEILMEAYPDMRPGYQSDDEILMEAYPELRPGYQSDDEILMEAYPELRPGGGDPQEEENAMLKQLLKEKEPASLLDILHSALKDVIINSIDDPNRQGKNSFVPSILKAYDEINKLGSGGVQRLQGGAYAAQLPRFQGGASATDQTKQQWNTGMGDIDPTRQNNMAASYGLGTTGGGSRAGDQPSGWKSLLGLGDTPQPDHGTIQPEAFKPVVPTDPTVPTAAGGQNQQSGYRGIMQGMMDTLYGNRSQRGQLGMVNRAGQWNDRGTREMTGAMSDYALQKAASDRADYGADLQGWQAQDASDRGWANLGLGAEQARGPGVWQNLSNLGMSFLANRK